MKMISLNTKMVAMNGCAVLMEANIATDVPTRLVDAAIASGCIPADSYTPTKAVVVEVEEEDSRGDAITDAINTLVGLADPADFGKDGTPKVRAVEKILGYDISAAERDAAWDNFHKE